MIAPDTPAQCALSMTKMQQCKYARMKPSQIIESRIVRISHRPPFPVRVQQCAMWRCSSINDTRTMKSVTTSTTNHWIGFRRAHNANTCKANNNTHGHASCEGRNYYIKVQCKVCLVWRRDVILFYSTHRSHNRTHKLISLWLAMTSSMTFFVFSHWIM